LEEELVRLLDQLQARLETLRRDLLALLNELDALTRLVSEAKGRLAGRIQV